MNQEANSAELQLAYHAERHEAYVSAYEGIPSESTTIREEIAGQALDEFRSYNQVVNSVVATELADLNEFETRLNDVLGEDFIEEAQRTKERAERLRKFRHSAYKVIGISIDPEFSDEIDADIQEAATIPDIRKQQRIVEIKKANESLYETIRSRLNDFVGELTPMEDSIVKALSLYADTGMEINRGTIAEVGGFESGWNTPIEYGKSRTNIMWAIERGCSELLEIKKVQKSENHTSGGVLTQRLEQE